MAVSSIRQFVLSKLDVMVSHKCGLKEINRSFKDLHLLIMFNVCEQFHQLASTWDGSTSVCVKTIVLCLFAKNLQQRWSSTLLPFMMLDNDRRQLLGKKSKSVFDFLTYSRATGFLFSYAKVKKLIRLIGASNEIDRVCKFDNSLSFGAKQNALRQIFFALWIF